MKNIPFSIGVLALLALAIFVNGLRDSDFDAVLDPTAVSIETQDQDAAQPAAASQIDAVYALDTTARVRKSVGKPWLNVREAMFTDVKELDGHRRILDKPKIDATLELTRAAHGFSGLGGNHFARADV